MKCKYCNYDGLEWPENWKKGVKPIESDTGTVHDQDRCKSQQGVNSIRKPGWIDIECVKCKVITRYNRKHYTENTVPKICRDCKMSVFDILDNFGVSL